MAVGGGKDLIGHDIGVGVAETMRSGARGQVVHRLIGQHPDLGVEQRHIDMLPLTGALAVGQCRLDGDDRVEAGEDIDIGDADLLRFALGCAGQVHKAAHGLDQKVVTGPRRVGTVLAEAGDRAIDDGRVDGLEARVVEAEPCQGADLEVLDEDIGTAGQPAHDLPPFLLPEIDHDRPLAAIAGMEIGGIAGAIAIVEDRRSPPPGIVARRALDLDHLSAEIGKDLTCPRPGEHTCQFKNLQPGERRCHECLATTFAYPNRHPSGTLVPESKANAQFCSPGSYVTREARRSARRLNSILSTKADAWALVA